MSGWPLSVCQTSGVLQFLDEVDLRRSADVSHHFRRAVKMEVGRRWEVSERRIAFLTHRAISAQTGAGHPLSRYRRSERRRRVHMEEWLWGAVASFVGAAACHVLFGVKVSNRVNLVKAMESAEALGGSLVYCGAPVELMSNGGWAWLFEPSWGWSHFMTRIPAGADRAEIFRAIRVTAKSEAHIASFWRAVLTLGSISGGVEFARRALVPTPWPTFDPRKGRAGR